MPSYAHITGRFLTYQESADTPIPLSGRVDFTPRTNAVGGGVLYGATRRTGYVLDGVLYEDSGGERPGLYLLAPDPALSPSEWSYRVDFHLQDEDGDRALVRSYDVAVTAGAELDLTAAAPLEDPVTGAPTLRGASAYEIAVSHGFVGTELDWLASLSTLVPGALQEHIADPNPHPTYDQTPDLALIFDGATI